ncbi:unnamed protein product [Lupinus luteus]|uniref:Uncharacterized protein n=1 Tax=Lupinus luteus TaxID=3873 RepID=A0AAV1WBI3_LUPLU
MDQHEKALLHSIENATLEVNTLRSQLERAEKRLEYAQSELALIRSIKTTNVETMDRGTKRKFDEKQHKDLISLMCKSANPYPLNFQKSYYISSQHDKKLRSLALCPVNDKFFATSAMDGIVNLWEVISSGEEVNLNSSTNCLTPEQCRWPEDIAWHPDGDRIFSVYNANSLDSQISIMYLSRVGEDPEEMNDINFLEHKPHTKGIINNISFMPWENACFVTGGSDHVVILWSENDEDDWRPKTLHKNLHVSTVMGVAGMQQKQIVLSVGKDKRIVGYDACAEREDFTHMIDSRCLSVIPNPCDYNLFMVQAGASEKQLRLFDIRTKQKELHTFGWAQAITLEARTNLITQAWSPNGMYITSGSSYEMIHIFDIRCNGQNPSQSFQAHDKGISKVSWLQSLPLLISMSPDNNIGLHKLV